MLQGVYNIVRAQLLVALRDLAVKAGLKITDVQQATLKVYALFDNTKNTLTFNLSDSRPVLAGEVLLSQNDAFVVKEVGTHLHQVEQPNGKLLPGNTLPLSYPDKTIFGAIQARCLNAFYGGTFTIKSDSEVRLDRLPMTDFLHIPQTQASATTSPMQSGLPTICMDNGIEFSGKRANEVTIQLGESDYANIQNTVANGTRNYALVTLSGFIIKNGSGSDEYIQNVRRLLEA
jgi:hypothetical protein